MKGIFNKGFRRNPRTQQSGLRTNQQVRAPLVVVVDDEGKNLGTMHPREAFFLAQSKGLDLVEISPNSDPPVCKIANYDHMRYEIKQKEKENRKKQKVIEMKEFHLSVNIAENDYQKKLSQAVEFVKDDLRIKVAIRMRGRELAHPEIAENVLKRFANDLDACAKLIAPIKQEGKIMSFIACSKK